MTNPSTELLLPLSPFCKNGELLESPSDDINTVSDILSSAVKEHGDRIFCLWRDLEDVHEVQKVLQVKQPDGSMQDVTKTWQLRQLSAVQSLTYKQFGERVNKIAASLRTLDVQPGKTRALIFSNSCKEWQLFAHAVFACNAQIVTAYDTLGASALHTAITECNITHVFLNDEGFPMLKDAIFRDKSKLPITHIFYHKTTKKTQQTVVPPEFAKNNIKVYSLEQLVGHKDLPTVPASSSTNVKSTKADRNQNACIMYTSGTTGAVKGVILTHGNIIANTAAGAVLVKSFVNPYEELFLAFLPLAHVLEFIVETILLYLGMPLAYGSPRTLKSEDCYECTGDFQTFSPTIMAGVPTIWNQLYKGISTKLQEASFIQRYLFDFTMNRRWQQLSRHQQDGTELADVRPSFWMEYIFKKIKEKTGGRLKLALTGGSAIAENCQKYLSCALCPLLQGYGATETTGLSTLVLPSKFRLTSVGSSAPACKLKLVSRPEYKYFVTDNPPAGEIYISGPAVSQGYFNRPAENKESFINGWFATGDIASLNSDGTLNIFDRVKNLVKLQNGEYIALENLETVYRTSNLVNNVCVVAKNGWPFALAVIEPNIPAIKAFLTSSGAGTSQPTTGSDINIDQPVVKNEIKRQLADAGKKAGLPNNIKDIIIATEEWTAVSGFLTDAMKLKRSKINERYEKILKERYDALSS